MHELVTLSITSFRFAMGGEHYYGKLDVRTKATLERQSDGSIREFTRCGYGSIRHPLDGHELTRRIDAKEALYLNKKDNEGLLGGSFRLKAGSEVKRFNGRDSVIEAAVRDFPTMFDETDVLVHQPDFNSDDLVVLVAPDDVRAAIERLDYDAREKWLRGNGYLVRPIDESPQAMEERTGDDEPR